jgi:hypothetical protein
MPYDGPLEPKWTERFLDQYIPGRAFTSNDFSVFYYKLSSWMLQLKSEACRSNYE